MTPTTHRPSRYGTTPTERKATILNAAVALAELDGYRTLTIQRVARITSMSPALVSSYYYSTDNLLNAVMEEAVRGKVLSVIAEGLAYRHPAAVNAPTALRQQAAATLVGTADTSPAFGGKA
jgi:AcrR family transcriptional regulator